MLKGPSSPTAMACRPRGFFNRNSPPAAECNNWLMSRTDVHARSSVELCARDGYAAVPAERLCVMLGGSAPNIDFCRLRLPDACLADARQGCERSKLGTEGNPLLRFGHHCRFACNGITQHGEAVSRSHHESVKAV